MVEEVLHSCGWGIFCSSSLMILSPHLYSPTELPFLKKPAAIFLHGHTWCAVQPRRNASSGVSWLCELSEWGFAPARRRYKHCQDRAGISMHGWLHHPKLQAVSPSKVQSSEPHSSTVSQRHYIRRQRARQNPRAHATELLVMGSNSWPYPRSTSALIVSTTRDAFIGTLLARWSNGVSKRSL